MSPCPRNAQAGPGVGWTIPGNLIRIGGTSMAADIHDAVVIGGSWAGLSAAMQLARARRRVLIVDSGSPRNRFAHHAHGFLGQDGRPPAEIRDAARAQVLAYPTAELR